MPGPGLTEEAVQFGEGGRLCGILTLPDDAPTDRPVFVFLNAGLLHRIGPHRLYVQLARQLARLGFASLRVDQSGKGDSPARAGLSKREVEAADHAEIVRGLESRLGEVKIVLAGLCSGADDAVRATPGDTRVVGLFLLDPICFPDAGFAARAFLLRYAKPARYRAWLRNRFQSLASRGAEGEVEIDSLTIRDAPTIEQLRSAFEAIRARDGRVLSVFTVWAGDYYNRAGQLGRILGMGDTSRFSTEILWRDVEHTYTLEAHRRRLVAAVASWVAGAPWRGCASARSEGAPPGTMET